LQSQKIEKIWYFFDENWRRTQENAESDMRNAEYGNRKKNPLKKRAGNKAECNPEQPEMKARNKTQKPRSGITECPDKNHKVVG